jgi:hypothetical protein
LIGEQFFEASSYSPDFWSGKVLLDQSDLGSSSRTMHEYHHHNMAASYGGLLLGGARGLGHHTSHHAAHHAHAAASYKEWTTATPPQSLVDASSAPPYPHGHYAPLSGE